MTSSPPSGNNALHKRRKASYLLAAFLFFGSLTMGFVVTPSLWLRYQIQQIYEVKTPEKRIKVAQYILTLDPNPKFIAQALNDSFFEEIHPYLGQILYVVNGNQDFAADFPEQASYILDKAFQPRIRHGKPGGPYNTSLKKGELISLSLEITDPLLPEIEYFIGANFTVRAPDGRIIFKPGDSPKSLSGSSTGIPDGFHDLLAKSTYAAMTFKDKESSGELGMMALEARQSGTYTIETTVDFNPPNGPSFSLRTISVHVD